MMRVKDHMDDIFEARGYFRKHVPQDANSLFRSVSDVLFGSQQHHTEMLTHAYHVRLKYLNLSEDDEVYGNRSHIKVRHLANMLNVTFHVLETANPDISFLRISPEKNALDLESSKCDGEEEMEKRFPLLAYDGCLPEEHVSKIKMSKRQKRDKSGKVVMLCYSGNQHYDPIFPKRFIGNAAMIQSLLYEILYKEIFKIPDAMEAANTMLNGDFDPCFGKPEVYNKDFQGTAMQALEKFLIPFPYKVAKTLDPLEYRNIEFDVWQNERRAKQMLKREAIFNNGYGKSCGDESQGRKRITIGDLERGTPCLLRDPFYGEVIGFVVKLAQNNKRLMEIYLPSYNTTLHVPREQVLPIGGSELVDYYYSFPSVPAGTRSLPQIESQQDEQDEDVQSSWGLDDESVKEAQNRNLLLSVGMPGWETRFDTTVPPPKYYPVGPPNSASVEEILAIANQLKIHEANENHHKNNHEDVAFPHADPAFPHADPAVLLYVDNEGNHFYSNFESSPISYEQTHSPFFSPISYEPPHSPFVSPFSPLLANSFFPPLQTPMASTGANFFQFPSPPSSPPAFPMIQAAMTFNEGLMQLRQRHEQQRNVFIFP